MWHHLAGQIERCDECRFDASAYTDEDVAGTLRNLAGWAGHTTAGVDHHLLNRRPTPTTWSPAEYLRHSKRVVWSMAGLAQAALAEDGLVVDGGPPPDATANDEVEEIDIVREIVRLHEESVRLLKVWNRLTPDEQARTMTLNGEPADIAGIVRHALHDVTHHLSDIGRGIVGLGAGTPSAAGVLDHVHSSNGGVPKRPLADAAIGYRGIDGDRQRKRKHHGRVWQALCLWSSDVIAELAAEGHPVGPGTAGENLTLSRIDWSTMRPGARLEFGHGDGPIIETTDYAEPCSTIAGSFRERDVRRIDADRRPGTSRIYAKVLRDGIVHPGDIVSVS